MTQNFKELIESSILNRYIGTDKLHDLHHDFIKNGYEHDTSNDSYSKELPHSKIVAFPNDDHFITTDSNGETTKLPMSDSSSIASIEKKALVTNGTPEQIMTDLYNKHNTKAEQRDKVSAAIKKSDDIDTTTRVLGKVLPDHSLSDYALDAIYDKRDSLGKDDFDKIRKTVGDNKGPERINHHLDYDYPKFIDKAEASSINTSPDRLDELSSSVPHEVLKNQRTEGNTIDKIHQENPMYAASHPNTNGDTLHKMLDNSRTSATIVSQILNRPDVSDEHKIKAISIPGSIGVSSAKTLLSREDTSGDVIRHIYNTHAGLKKDAARHVNAPDLKPKKVNPEIKPEIKQSIMDLFNRKYAK